MYLLSTMSCKTSCNHISELRVRGTLVENFSIVCASMWYAPPEFGSERNKHLSTVVSIWKSLVRVPRGRESRRVWFCSTLRVAVPAGGRDATPSYANDWLASTPESSGQLFQARMPFREWALLRALPNLHYYALDVECGSDLQPEAVTSPCVREAPCTKTRLSNNTMGGLRKLCLPSCLPRKLGSRLSSF